MLFIHTYNHPLQIHPKETPCLKSLSLRRLTVSNPASPKRKPLFHRFDVRRHILTHIFSSACRRLSCRFSLFLGFGNGGNEGLV
jgi:hypothetical protein